MDTERLSIEKTTQELGISRKTLYRWTKIGFIKHIKVGLSGVEYEPEEVARVKAGVRSEGGE